MIRSVENELQLQLISIRLELWMYMYYDHWNSFQLGNQLVQLPEWCGIRSATTVIRTWSVMLDRWWILPNSSDIARGHTEGLYHICVGFAIYHFHKSHNESLPYLTIHYSGQKRVHFVLNRALQAIGKVHAGICKIGLLWETDITM